MPKSARKSENATTRLDITQKNKATAASDIELLEYIYPGIFLGTFQVIHSSHDVSHFSQVDTATVIHIPHSKHRN